VELYLVRHAIAHDRDPEAWPDDAKRPLTEEGDERFRRAARGLRRVVPSVDIVLASPYVRAWQTAVILSEEGGWPAPEPCPELEAERPARQVIPVIGRRARTTGSLALVGHEPQLSELASRLLTGSEDAAAIEMKKGAVACLWVEGAGDPVLRWLAPPRILRALAP
jgi:phosphohistidine phosphatase